jgi:hypothetical protein
MVSKMNKKDKETLTTQIKDTIASCTKRQFEVVLFYKLLVSNQTSETAKKNEIDSIIEGTKHRLLALGVLPKMVEVLDISIDESEVDNYKLWRIKNDIKSDSLGSITAYLNQVYPGKPDFEVIV